MIGIISGNFEVEKKKMEINGKNETFTESRLAIVMPSLYIWDLLSQTDK